MIGIKCRIDKINKLSWSDLVLLKIRWLQGGRDVEFTFREPGQPKSDNRKRLVYSHWASGLQVDTKLPINSGGALLTVDAEASLYGENEIAFRCEFGSSGSIELVCSDLEVSLMACAECDEISPGPHTQSSDMPGEIPKD